MKCNVFAILTGFIFLPFFCNAANPCAESGVQSGTNARKCIGGEGGLQRKIAVQIYSFRKFTVEEALKSIKSMGIDAVEASPSIRIGGDFKDQRIDLGITPEAKEYVKKLLADNDMKFTGYGVVNTTTEEQVEEYCKLAHEFGIKYVLTEDPVSQFKYWNKYGEKYDVVMLVHHHAMDSKNQYWHPEVMRRFVSEYDRVMANPDIGHWVRCSIDPVEAAKILVGEIGSIHAKDQRTFGSPRNDPVPIGDGAINLKAFLKELDRQGYGGYLVIEHETDWDNPVPPIEKSIKFLREN